MGVTYELPLWVAFLPNAAAQPAIRQPMLRSPVGHPRGGHWRHDRHRPRRVHDDALDRCSTRANRNISSRRSGSHTDCGALPASPATLFGTGSRSVDANSFEIRFAVRPSRLRHRILLRCCACCAVAGCRDGQNGGGHGAPPARAEVRRPTRRLRQNTNLARKNRGKIRRHRVPGRLHFLRVEDEVRALRVGRLTSLRGRELIARCTLLRGLGADGRELARSRGRSRSWR